jgi:putative endonuclease
VAAKDDLGRRGEQLAAEYLESRGLEILDRNWRCAHGEVDLVARDGPVIAVVEVKTRSGTGYGHPLEAITREKLARLRRLAGAWQAAHPDVRGPLRVDAVGVILPRDGDRTIEHLTGVFR